MQQQQMTIYDWLEPDQSHAMPSGKTYPDACHRESRKGQTSKLFSRSSSASQSRMLPMFLFLKRDGQSQESSWENIGPWLTRSMMPNGGGFHSAENGCVSLLTTTDTLLPGFSLELNFGEMPKVPNPTKLSDVLEETTVDPRYYLSSRACQGILNRASKRGKELPEILKTALENQINASSEELHSEN